MTHLQQIYVVSVRYPPLMPFWPLSVLIITEDGEITVFLSAILLLIISLQHSCIGYPGYPRITVRFPKNPRSDDVIFLFLIILSFYYILFSLLGRNYLIFIYIKIIPTV